MNAVIARGNIIRPIHASLQMWIESGAGLFPDIRSFLLGMSSEFHADLAFIHAVAAEEVASGRQSETITQYNRKGDRHDIIVTTHQLIRFLPQLYWGTLFGAPYVRLFGEERLLSAPAPVVRKLDYGGIYIQLSDSPYDFISDYPRLEGIRQQVKEHLGINAFFDPHLPRNHQYDVPTFVLDSERYRRQPTEEEYNAEETGPLTAGRPLREQVAAPPASLEQLIEHAQGTCSEEQASSALADLRAFMAALHDWEMFCSASMRPTSGQTYDPHWQERARLDLERILSLHCTPSRHGRLRTLSFRNPPEYDPQLEQTISAEIKGSAAIIETQQTTGFGFRCRYTLKRIGDRWLVHTKKFQELSGEFIATDL